MCFKRRKDLQCTTRSTSRWKQVRMGQGAMATARPLELADRQARGDRVCRSSSSVRSRMV
ncbi:MAG: hypothetical protein HDT33_05440 [Clostridiales bacterium]|nr:hypothetical protein [Clostridiales bacterium]